MDKCLLYLLDNNVLQKYRTMITISSKAQNKLTNNQRAIAKLVLLFDVHAKTIERWIESKDIRLTTPQAIEIIKEETDLIEDHILTNVPKARA